MDPLHVFLLLHILHLAYAFVRLSRQLVILFVHSELAFSSIQKSDGPLIVTKAF